MPRNTIITAFLVALLAVGLTACSDSDTSPTGNEDLAVDDYSAMDLNLEYGGLTTTDEEPAFDDPYLRELDVLDEEEVHADALLDDPEVQQLLALAEAPADTGEVARPRRTFLRLVWGALDGPETGEVLPEDGSLLDWTGQLSVDRGVILVRRVILFERPYDHLVLPRPDRHTVSWVSHTGGHVDGLIVQIIEPPVAEDGSADPLPPNQLHLRTASFSRDFDLDSISGLDEIVEIEPAGNGIHLAAFTLGDVNPCPRGFLAGRWCDDPETEEPGGMFRGRWIDIFGLSRGYMLGRWGVNDEGEQVFAGKYISRRGAFLGLLQGEWTAAEEPGRGSFAGHWAGEQGQIEGYLAGRWLQRPERPCGVFQGRWATDCDDEALISLGL